MNNIDKTLNNLFNLPVIEGEFMTENQTIIPINNSLESDCDNTRDNLYQLLQTGQDALESALEIAKDSENPRAFEVVGNLIKQLSDINHQIIDIHAKRQKLEPKEGMTNITNNNAIFCGSTAELNTMITKLTKGE
jgi:hypothetical protein